MKTIQEFKKQARNLASSYGLTKNISIVTERNWIRVRIDCQDSEIFSNLKKELEALAGYKNHSDIYSDYHEYEVNVKNVKYNCKYSGLIITKSY